MQRNTIERGLFLGAAGLTGYKVYRAVHENRAAPKPAPENYWHTGEGKKEADQFYARTVDRIEQLAQRLRLDHRFVGGTLTDVLTVSTKAAYDFDNKTITLTDYKPHEMFRSSDGTVKDVDMTCYTSDHGKVALFREIIAAEKKEAKASGQPYPDVNIEPARHPDNKRNPLTQFVSGVDIDETGNPSFVFGNIKQPISKESLEAWKIRLKGGPNDGSEFTTSSPFAHAAYYAMRVPSGYKPKDLVRKYGKDIKGNPYNKIELVKLIAAQADPEKGLRFWHEYEKGVYGSWMEFVRKMYQTTDTFQSATPLGIAKEMHPVSYGKALITAVWWRTLGTWASHGAGSSMTGIFTG